MRAGGFGRSPDARRASVRVGLSLQSEVASLRVRALAGEAIRCSQPQDFRSIPNANSRMGGVNLCPGLPPGGIDITPLRGFD